MFFEIRYSSEKELRNSDLAQKEPCFPLMAPLAPVQFFVPPWAMFQLPSCMPGTWGLALGLDLEVLTGSAGGHPLGGGGPEPQGGAWPPSLGGDGRPGQHDPGRARESEVGEPAVSALPPGLCFFLTACHFCVCYVSVLFSSSVSEFVSSLLGRKEFLLLVEPGESSEGGAGPAEQERGEP